ncbi:hypothetical protein Acr_23g0019800 [Actinidia rufa]|uniref:DUF4283 domain-containing protein n=1 Tax=Actinidia rufa TaxID=165716 RepID=A0A7J0GRZ3_9ERIC|nr:hypothetical protein Acr_23g0019800 [Actinidia rufa]
MAATFLLLFVSSLSEAFCQTLCVLSESSSPRVLDVSSESATDSSSSSPSEQSSRDSLSDTTSAEVLAIARPPPTEDPIGASIFPVDALLAAMAASPLFCEVVPSFTSLTSLLCDFGADPEPLALILFLPMIFSSFLHWFLIDCWTVRIFFVRRTLEGFKGWNLPQPSCLRFVRTSPWVKKKIKAKGSGSAPKSHNNEVSEVNEGTTSQKSGLAAIAASNVSTGKIDAPIGSSVGGGRAIASTSAEVVSESESLEDCSEGEEEDESVADSDETSRTLGEDDSDTTQGVQQNASEREETNKRRNAAAIFPPKNPWITKSAVSLFAGNRIPENGLKLQKIEVGDGPIKFEEENVPKEDWNYCLMGYVAGRFPGKKAIQQLVTSWKEKVSLHYHSSGWIVFKFDNLEGRDNILQGGPYMVFGRPLLLKILPDYFSFIYEELSCILVWVQLDQP